MAFGDKAAVRPLELVFSGIVGPLKHYSLGRAKHFVTLLGAYNG